MQWGTGWYSNFTYSFSPQVLFERGTENTLNVPNWASDYPPSHRGASLTVIIAFDIKPQSNKQDLLCLYGFFLDLDSPAYLASRLPWSFCHFMPSDGAVVNYILAVLLKQDPLGEFYAAPAIHKTCPMKCRFRVEHCTSNHKVTFNIFLFTVVTVVTRQACVRRQPHVTPP